MNRSHSNRWFEFGQVTHFAWRGWVEPDQVNRRRKAAESRPSPRTRRSPQLLAWAHATSLCICHFPSCGRREFLSASFSQTLLTSCSGLFSDFVSCSPKWCISGTSCSTLRGTLLKAWLRLIWFTIWITFELNLGSMCFEQNFYVCFHSIEWIASLEVFEAPHFPVVSKMFPNFLKRNCLNDNIQADDFTLFKTFHYF